ncbi:2-octaprenyl-6-methoxyphenyl hydroxylase [Balneatrix alpica]|uniref:2-octaprenyl-6-methoxyphenyl hydroxylase n=1 Tax=Balneatrix alpica TaxID=75684 RepID=A0ABV5ZEX0_9GAMM|nr:2-octaprenyl-6-methoxyphenyl hydroxylase [Balneatrix alpica]
MDYDLVIVGGGLVGASLAVALLPASQRFGWRMAVVEPFPLPAQAAPDFQPSFDARGTAFSYGTRLLYEEMGVWQALSSQAEPIRHIHVSDQGRYGATRLHADEEGVPALGYVVENHWVGQVLLTHLQQHGGEQLHWYCPAQVEHLQALAGGMQVQLQDGQQLRARLVILADGGRSQLSERLGLEYQESPYHQHALVTTLASRQPHQGWAFERFTGEGPLALLPLPAYQGQSRSALVWTTPEELIDERMGWDDQYFCQQVQQVFGQRLGRFTQAGERYHYPLKLRLAKEQVRPHLVVLGNAAHALHPIAGQGYNLALRGVMALAEQLIHSHLQGQELGQLSSLQAYLASRQQDQWQTIAFSDKVMKLFSNTHPALGLARDLGLVGLNLCSPARHQLARAAMGLQSPLVNLGLPQ